MRKLHLLSALPIGAYACVHILNHLVGLKGVEAHIGFMRSCRAVYRFPAVEAILLLAIASQIYTGTTFVVRGWKRRRGLVPWLQAGSGAYLAFFLLAHVGAVLLGRFVLGLDTNFYFAAAGLHVPPFQLFFAPYYLLAVWALPTHLGCALYWQLQGRSNRAQALAVALPSAAGLVASLLIVMSLAGVFYPLEIPASYLATYGRLP